MAILRELHVVLNFKNETATSTHASLSDLLFDKSQSNKFYIDPQRCHVDIVLHILRSNTHWEPNERNAEEACIFFSLPSPPELPIYLQSGSLLNIW